MSQAGKGLWRTSGSHPKPASEFFYVAQSSQIVLISKAGKSLSNQLQILVFFVIW